MDEANAAVGCNLIGHTVDVDQHAFDSPGDGHQIRAFGMHIPSGIELPGRLNPDAPVSESVRVRDQFDVSI